MGGGNDRLGDNHHPSRGLSPRGRGKPQAYAERDNAERSIPAWAGETCRVQSARGKRQVYPRVGGGNVYHRQGTLSHGGLSPRGRGKPLYSSPPASDRRSIPAWAGETALVTTIGYDCTVYPRVGGGNETGYLRIDDTDGLSPRGRGKR